MFLHKTKASLKKNQRISADSPHFPKYNPFRKTPTSRNTTFFPKKTPAQFENINKFPRKDDKTPLYFKTIKNYIPICKKKA